MPSADPTSHFVVLITLAHVLVARLQAFLAAFLGVFLQPGSQFSLWSLLSALLIATLFLAVRLRRRGRPVRLRTLRRLLFPQWLLRSRSTKADLGFFLLNNFAVGAMIGWALFSFTVIQHTAQSALASIFGPMHARGIDPLTADIIQTVAMFLAYEFAYWFDHYLCHEIPFLWEFHRVHHTAETLSPVTVFRVHPVDSLVFYNIAVLVMGLTNALTAYAVGVPGHGVTIGGANILGLAGIFLLGHLQHSHVWIAFTGLWGRLFLSPAHHQIHHSTDPAHFGKNLGSSIGLWDWLFGTLMLPEKKRQNLVFGVEPGQYSPHTITGCLVTPFVRCLDLLPSRAAKILVAQDQMQG